MNKKLRENVRISAVSRSDADRRNGVHHKRKFLAKVMVWLSVCFKGASLLVIFKEGTVNHDRYIREVLPVALEYKKKVFGNYWTFQQDGAAKPHAHRLTQEWCRKNFPSLIDKDQWSPNTPDLNPPPYSIWNELAQMIIWERVTSKTSLIEQLK